MIKYFAVAEGWRPTTGIHSYKSVARLEAIKIIERSSRKSASVYCTNGEDVWFSETITCGASGKTFKSIDSDHISKAINKDGSLRAGNGTKDYHHY